VKWVALAVAAVPVALISASLLIGSTPDEEEFRFAVLTTWLHVRAVMQGHYDFWTPLLGLGLPQPLTPNFLLHPLSPLLPLLGPITWGRTFVVAHTLLGAAGMWQVTKSLALSPIVRAICVVSFLLATPVQNYVLADFWPSHYMVWTSMPWLLLLAWRGLEAEGRVLRRRAIALGLCCGLVVANTNPGHVIVYATVAIAVAIANGRRVAARWQWFVVAAMLAAAIASPTLVQLAHERTFFASDIQRSDVPDPLPPSASWNALFSPIPPPSTLPINEQLPFTRTLFFGGPFLALAIAGCFWFARTRFDLVLALVLSAILLFTSFLSFPGVSARFHFRDPLTLAAILLAGLTLDRLLSIRRARTLAAGLAVVQLAVVVWSAWPALSRTWQPDAQAARWFRGATGDTGTVETLLALMRVPGRVLFSPEVDRAMYARELLEDGLGVNALAYRGVPVVNGWFKGVSADVVSPDERLFYARVQPPRAFVASDADLDVLGVRYVVAREGESVGPNLVRRGRVGLRNGTELAVYENDDAWPEVFLIDDADVSSAVALPQCGNGRLLCKDLSVLMRRRSTAGVTVAGHDAEVHAALTGVDRPGTLVLGQMFRPDWAATVDGRSARTSPVAGALLGVAVPAGARSVHLRYRPTAVIAATFVAWIAIVSGMAALVILGKPRRWRS